MEKLISNSRVSEIYAVTNRIILAYGNTQLSTDVNLTGIMTHLSTKNSALKAAINRLEATSNLADKDDFRDDGVRSLGLFLQGNLYNPDPVIKAATQVLYDVFNRYGMSIISESYASESSMIDSLLNDLAAESLQTSIAAIPGCDSLISNLETAQNDFEAARVAYDEEKALQLADSNASKLKYEVVGIVNDQLVDYVKALSKVGIEEYIEFANTISEMIAENNEVVKKRRKS